MTREICTAFAVELVECARQRKPLPGDLDAHLELCEDCQSRWEAETQVSAGLAQMRREALAFVPDSRRVMAAFDDRFRAGQGSNRFWLTKSNWAWALAAAAMLTITLRVVMPLRPQAVAEKGLLVTAASDAYLASNDAQFLTSEDFVALPFTPPLAAGELVRIVETNLDPQELAAYGFETDPGWTSAVSAELVLGEDGNPRAVRITDSAQF